MAANESEADFRSVNMPDGQVTPIFPSKISCLNATRKDINVARSRNAVWIDLYSFS